MTANGRTARPRARAAVPCRACLSGEDLDWLGGRSVSLALDLRTTVEIPAEPPAEPGLPGPPGPPGPPRPSAQEAESGWPAQVWAWLRRRLPDAGLAARPPAVTVHSDAPAASGLSSSTALIVALFRAFTDACAPEPRISARTLAQWAYEFEFAVFNGGGMDHLAVIAGDALLIQGRTTGLPLIREQARFPDEWAVLVVDSATRKDTGDHIRTVRARLAAGDPRLSAYTARTDETSAAVWEALGARDLGALGAAMSGAHGAMRDLQGMSTEVLEELRVLALRATGLPLKLSGAGGGGALVGVCRAAERETIAKALREAYRPVRPGARVIPAEAAPGLD
ncbi:galactokinase [Streptomyces sp. N2-109]|uniref:Galactokinase n=1 Tax=Streptomyces gossypii TaxID=2883101 RepID=A0ABT2JV42_9ACTN|nr:galactokinase [Streptomyces gossypii]MCT2591767.1 galactokinase [Streptomyces gossypii]